MKNSFALIIGLVLVLLAILGVGVYYYLNNQNKIAPEVSVVRPTAPAAPSATPTLTLLEEIKFLDEETPETDLQDLQKDLLGL